MSFLSIENTTVTVDGHTVEGWANASDALMLPSISAVTAQRGADGTVSFSSTGVKGGAVTLKLLGTSPSAAYFARMASREQSGAPELHQMVVTYHETGQQVYCTDGALSEFPSGQTLGNAEPAIQEYTFEFSTISRVADVSTS